MYMYTNVCVFKSHMDIYIYIYISYTNKYEMSLLCLWDYIHTYIYTYSVYIYKSIQTEYPIAAAIVGNTQLRDKAPTY